MARKKYNLNKVEQTPFGLAKMLVQPIKATFIW